MQRKQTTPNAMNATSRKLKRLSSPSNSILDENDIARLLATIVVAAERQAKDVVVAQGEIAVVDVDLNYFQLTTRVDFVDSDR